MGSVCSTKSKENQIFDSATITKKNSQMTGATSNLQTSEKPKAQDPEFEDEKLKFFLDPSFYESLKLGRTISELSSKLRFQHSEEVELCYTFFSRSSILLQICEENNILIPSQIKDKLTISLDEIFSFLSKVKEEKEEERSQIVKINVKTLLFNVIELYYFIYFLQEESDFSFMESRWWRPLKDEDYIERLKEKLRKICNTQKVFEETQNSVPFRDNEEVETPKKTNRSLELEKQKIRFESQEEEDKEEKNPEMTISASKQEKLPSAISEEEKSKSNLESRKSSYSQEKEKSEEKIKTIPSNEITIPIIEGNSIPFHKLTNYIHSVYEKVESSFDFEEKNAAKEKVKKEEIEKIEEIEEKEESSISNSNSQKKFEEKKEIPNKETLNANEDIDKLYNFYTGKENSGESSAEEEKKDAIIQEAD